ncbi:MAG TPA: CBS domain-containing protein [Blastocatellia bacterium]|nr:CBS domain-containing protein [Blastocatellia bacterium]
MSTLNSIVSGRETYTIDKGMTVLQAIQYMTEKRIGAVAVVDGDRLVGVFSERDLMTRVVAPQRPADKTFISEVMTRDVTHGHPDESYEQGLARMQHANCRHLPIVKDGSLLGFISLRDLMQVDIDKKTEELKLMHEYIHCMPMAASGQT